MSRQEMSELKPFVSLLLILVTLFSIVFIKMEVRRSGYVMLKQSRLHKKMQDKYHMKVSQYAKLTRPDRLQRLASSRMTLRKPGFGQIVQISGKKIALKY